MFKRKVDEEPCDSCWPARFEQVLEQELAYFAERRRLKRKPERAARDDNAGEYPEDECDNAYAAGIVAEANKARLTGLAFSGGGIRSATFNLGVLQALARLKLLDQFDYLSTVSGGGYIGSWFAAWIRRKDRDPQTWAGRGCDAKASSGLEAVACELAASVGAGEDGEPRAAVQPDPAPIWHLREYSNYLSPRRGLWSTDTWTLGITYVRNLVLTFSLLLATLITLVLGTRMIASLYFGTAHGQYDLAYVLVPVLFCLFLSCASLLAGIELSGHPGKHRGTPWVSYLAVISTLLASATGALWLWQTVVSPRGMFTIMLVNIIPGDLSLFLLELLDGNKPFIMAALPVLLSALLGWTAGLLIGQSLGRGNAAAPETNNVPPTSAKGKSRSGWLVIAASSLVSAGVFAGLLLLLGSWMKRWLPADIESWNPALWHIVVWGTPLLVLVFSVIAVVFVGLAGRALGELDREWLGRFFAALSKWTVVTTFLMVLVVYSSCWVDWLGDYVGGLINLGIGTAWVALSSAGAFLARNAMTAKSTGRGWLKKAVMAVAPYVFILGMLILTVWVTDKGVHWLVGFFKLVAPVNGDPPGFWYLMAKVDVWLLLIMLAITALVTVLWSWRVGVNRFSLHSLYGDRLIRAYLGASNLERDAHPFTGFDDSDNEVHIPELARGKHAYSGPYPIINAAINLVSSRRLAWQKRKAASFTFTPQFCGYEFCGEKDAGDEGDRIGSRRTGRIGGYVDSGCYAGQEGKGLSLGKAMTISGAAASPNMGYHSSPALTFLMTTFNVRLGWWLPNTAIKNPDLVAKRGPGWGLLYLLFELLGMTGARSKYVYLSDGGHFENLGIYELVRRRCRIIVACDAEADPDMAFSGLGNAIEKCRTDLGVPIEIDVAQIKPDPVTGRSQRHCAVGCIRYSEADPGQPDGTLLYIKASLTGDEPQDVLTYANSHASFPHETTADQWFDETQFESYRTLGEHTVMRVLETAVHVAGSAEQGREKRMIERVFLEARKQWYSGSGAPADKPADHDALLESIMDTLRTDTRLAFLDEQLYPNLQKIADAYSYRGHERSIPATYREFRAGFYFCKRLIQFMQQVYYDRQLDQQYAAPRNRGWMNLFRRWSWSLMLRFTWTVTAGTYGARFQTFCEHHLDLESGEPELGEKVLETSAARSPESGEYRMEEFDWKEAKKESGLHEYETHLISVFLDAYIQHEDLKDLKNLSEPVKFRIFPLMVATDDPITPQVDSDMKLNAGFLITGPALYQPDGKPPCYKEAVLYFRIRPSMRNMDLARKAFLECRKHEALRRFRLIENLPVPALETRAVWMRRVYRDIYTMDRGNLDHCRWYSQVLEEEAEDGEA